MSVSHAKPTAIMVKVDSMEDDAIDPVDLGEKPLPRYPRVSDEQQKDRVSRVQVA